MKNDTQIHDVTVLMKGSETETSTQKLLHDTFTDWVKTDLPAASNILGPNGRRTMRQIMRKDSPEIRLRRI